MKKGKLYKSIVTDCIILTSDELNVEMGIISGVVVQADEFTAVGHYSSFWDINDFVEFVGQLSLNNVTL